MASPILADLVSQVTRSTTVMDSAEQLILGIQSRVDTAVAAALANGATAAELEPLTALSAALGAEADQLTAAVSANTPAAPVVTPVSARR